MQQRIKVIDLFAGPGGLGEGFASVGSNDAPTFKIAASVEKEASAHKTLTLRAFTREFKNRALPDEYYQYVRGEITKDCLIEKYPTQWDAANVETLRRPTALGEDNQIIHDAIDKALGKDKAPWILIGGPPCQAYSLVGRSRNSGTEGYVAEQDGRHFLYKEYLDIIEKFKPSVFVMENVKGMLSSSPTGAPIFEKMLDDLKSPGGDRLKYKIFSLSNLPRSYEDGNPILAPKDFVVKAENYGVPQARHRVILIGVRSDLDLSPEELLLRPQSEVTLNRVLDEMPKLRSGLSKNDSFGRWGKLVKESIERSQEELQDLLAHKITPDLSSSRGEKFIQLDKYPLSSNISEELYQWFCDPKLEGILDHQARGHMDSDIARYAFVASYGEKLGRSPKLVDFPESLLPDHKNVKSNKFADRFKVQLKNKPATTITSHISKDGHYYIHYDVSQCRSLTVREAARIQTFPDNYFFEGNRTQQYVQVGNAVPPFLARKIGEVVAKILAKTSDN
jgi:DNA (cytosine-5)-methyltransferase 1